MSKSQQQGKRINGVLLTIMELFTILSCFITGYSWWLYQAKEHDEHQPEKKPGAARIHVIRTLYG